MLCKLGASLCIFLHLGQGGVGKSTSLKQLALLWANRESKELEQFDIVYHIALNSVKKDEALEEIILRQWAEEAKCESSRHCTCTH